MPLSEADKWLDHLGSCSPCYADFKRFQETHEWRRRRMLLAVAAGVLVGLSVTGWALLHKRSDNLTAQTAVLDLRERSHARGIETNPNEQPLELSLKVSELIILLPLGSSEGTYDVRVATLSDKTVFVVGGNATLEDQVTSLKIALRLSSLSRGKYLLQIRRRESEWTTYPLILR